MIWYSKLIPTAYAFGLLYMQVYFLESIDIFCYLSLGLCLANHLLPTLMIVKFENKEIKSNFERDSLVYPEQFKRRNPYKDSISTVFR